MQRVSARIAKQSLQRLPQGKRFLLIGNSSVYQYVAGISKDCEAIVATVAARQTFFICDTALCLEFETRDKSALTKLPSSIDAEKSFWKS